MKNILLLNLVVGMLGGCGNRRENNAPKNLVVATTTMVKLTTWVPTSGCSSTTSTPWLKLSSSDEKVKEILPRSDASNQSDPVTVLETHDLTVAYDKKPVLYGIDVEVTAGQLVGIMGPNGAGKSTLIKAIMGLLDPASGWIKIFGEPHTSQRRRISYERLSMRWRSAS